MNNHGEGPDGIELEDTQEEKTLVPNNPLVVSVDIISPSSAVSVERGLLHRNSRKSLLRASVASEVDHPFGLLSPAGEISKISLPDLPNETEQTTDASDVQFAREKGCKKYRHALKMLYPYRCNEEDGQYARIDRVGFFSFMLFSWMTGLMWKAYKRGLRQQDLWKTSIFDCCQRNTDRLQRIWESEVAIRGEKDASFFHACWIFCRTRLIFAGLVYWLCLTLGFLGPTLFVQRLIEYANDRTQSDEKTHHGLMLVLGLALSELSRAVLFVGVWGLQYRTCVRLRAACNGIIYRKIFTLDNLEQVGSSSEMVNLIAADVNRVFEAARQCLLMIGGPILMVGGTAYSVWLLGYMAFVGAGVLVLFYPVQVILSRTLAKLRRRSVKETDARIHLMTEIINSIRLIKMYAWEGPFDEKVKKMRKEEKKHLAVTAWTQSMNLSLTLLVPVIAAVVTFLSHLANGGELQPSQAFTLLTIYYATRSAYYGMPFALRAYADCLPSCERLKAFNILIIFYIIGAGGIRQIVISFLPILTMRTACGRIQKFLLIKPVHHVIPETASFKAVLNIQSMTFGWTPPDELHVSTDEKSPLASGRKTVSALQNITVNIYAGQLIGFCGQVGSGKSSLFQGILGQIYLSEGTMARRGRIAYVPQQAWLVNDTVRENICFGEKYDYKRYSEVISVCCLMYDFAILPNGDETVIGERGTTLSGGQRQRINIARAVYSDRDILLFDDPLSAVDATVGAAIFERCIYQYLRNNGKTVLLISGQVQYLERCDKIFVIKSGYIVQEGTHAEMVKDIHSEYGLLVTASQKERVTLSENARLKPKNVIDHGQPGAQPENAAEVKAEETGGEVEEMGLKQNVSHRTYHRYITAAGGYCAVTAILLLIAVNMGMINFISWWLNRWLKLASERKNVTFADNSTRSVPYIRLRPETAFYPVVYVGAVVVVILMGVVRSYSFMKITLHAAMRLHQRIFGALMRAATRFYDTTPAGRILTRLSKDIDEVDSQIPFVLEIFLQNGFYCFFSVLIICTLMPYLTIAVVILTAFLVLIVLCFRCGVRDFKRIDNNTISPILSLAASTIQGFSTIQAYQRQHDLIKRFEVLVDTNTFPTFCFHCAIRWLGLRLDFLTISFTICIALLVVLMPEGKGINPAEVGLCLSFAIQLSGMFQYTVRLALETEGRFTSVDRITDYIDNIPQESIQKVDLPVSDNWPTEGRIALENVVLRYHETLPPALKGVTFTVEPGERVGIVGRTGSGKSSIAAALFRLDEIEGHILIDGYDIKSISLHTLRTRLSIIPQDPILFAGSLRYNLDPFDQYTEEEVWSALHKVNLRDMVVNLVGHLQYPVTQNGANFSVGERQLLCMARALLRRSRILFMDEATASIDSRTDSVLQETIRTAFHGCTMLTVAHRLNTVIDYDKILVVSDGVVAEFDTPVNLMGNSQSVFSTMVNSSLAAH